MSYPTRRHTWPTEAIERIRAQDKYLRASLAREIPALMKQTKTMRRNELTVGRRYGVLGISPFANAVRTARYASGMERFTSISGYSARTGCSGMRTPGGHLEFSAYPCHGEAEGILVEV